MLAVGKATGEEHPCLTRIASGLGGGIGGQREACGALTGGALVLGLVYGSNHADDTAARDRVRAQTQAFTGRFAAANGGLRCGDILARKEQRGETGCQDVVDSAVRALLALVRESERE